MFRISLAVAASVAAMSLATSADALIMVNGMSLNGASTNVISFNGQPLAGLPTVGALAGAKDADPRAAVAKTEPLAVEAVILPTGETVDLR
jgi:hypothetical protein